MLANNFVVTALVKVSKSLFYSYHMGAVLKPYSAWKKMSFGDIMFVDTKWYIAVFSRFHFSKATLPSDDC